MRRAVLGFTCLLALSACSGEKGTPTAVETTPTTDATPQDGAVRIDDPLDAEPFYAKPCELLTAEQVAPFQVAPVGVEGTSTESPSCTWEPTDRRGDFSVTFTLALPNGLSDQYKAQDELHKYDLWEPTEVSGYPAVFTDIRDRRDKGDCGVVVGINDNVTVDVYRQSGNGPEACDRVVEMAEQVLVTLKGA